ncbi:MAG: hypothetical protein ACW99G_24550 [Candidatus Thorarchaeota archaeon]|jgi:hypothetical protein
MRLDNNQYLSKELTMLHSTVQRILGGDEKAFNFFRNHYGIMGKVSRSQLAMIVLEDHTNIYKTEVTELANFSLEAVGMQDPDRTD